MEYKLISPVSKGESKIERILKNRGIEDINHYLNTDETDIISPTKIFNIDNGIKMLIQHIKNNDDMHITIDEDCDGYASSSLFINYLYNLFPSYVENHIYYSVHQKKSHGVELTEVPPWCKLAVIIDAGSNQFEEHNYFYENNIDVLIIDHHECEIPSNYNKAIIINNNANYNDIENPYPTKSLCGTAMAYKFCCRIDELLKTNYAENYKDMVALAEIADMMSMKDFESIELVREGLSNIKNPFFAELLNRNKSRFTNGLTAMSIAFYIVPYINAVSRVGNKDDRILMFEGMLEYKANNLIPSTKRGHKGEEERLVEQAARVCSNLKQTKQTAAMTIGYDIAEGKIKDENLLEDKFIIIQFEKDIVEADINGLIANKLMAKYQRPVLVLQPHDGMWAGSGRGYDKGGLADFRKFLENSELVEYAQGRINGMALKQLFRFINGVICKI